MILLTLSRGKGEETVRLQLPASPAEIGETFAFLDRISLDTTATAILDVSSNVPVLYRCLYDVDVEDSEQFQKLQKLEERTEALSPAKAAIFSGALDAECVWNLEGALTVADRLDEYTLHRQDGVVQKLFTYPLGKEERALLRKQMEADYLGRTGKTLNDYYAQLDMEREAPPELTAGTKRLPVDAVSFTDEITECDGKLNFYIPINFDPDAVFGTNVASAFNDDWLNVYANFGWKTGRIDSALTVCLVCSDGHEFEFFYPLTSAEQVQLWNQMDAYCHQQNGQSLGETRTALLREQAEEGLEIRL